MIPWIFLRAGEYPSGSELFSLAPSFLSPAEIAYLGTLRFPRRREDWLAGRWAAKRLLAALQLGGEPFAPTETALLRSPSGAPVLHHRGRPLPHSLSLSHRAGGVLCACCPLPGVALGVDLEWVEDRHPAFYQDYFTPAEQAFAAEVEPYAPAVWFTLLWSAKEAVLKSLGLGLKVDPRRIEISADPHAWQALHLPASASVWQLFSVHARDLSVDAPQRLWAQRRGDFVLTCALKAKGPANLAPAEHPIQA